jgi:hypothetical protein
MAGLPIFVVVPAEYSDAHIQLESMKQTAHFNLGFQVALRLPGATQPTRLKGRCNLLADATMNRKRTAKLSSRKGKVLWETIKGVSCGSIAIHGVDLAHLAAR